LKATKRRNLVGKVGDEVKSSAIANGSEREGEGGWVSMVGGFG